MQTTSAADTDQLPPSLLPCPFCGSEVKLGPCSLEGFLLIACSVGSRCKSSKCGLFALVQESRLAGGIAAWNQRVSAPTGMSRDEAFELLEAHAGPRASLHIIEEANRYFIKSAGKRRDESVEWTVFIKLDEEPFTSFRRETLSEAVAAALANVPQYRKEGE